MKNIQFIFLKISAILFILGIASQGFTQENFPTPDSKALKTFKQSTTYLVLEDEMISDYNTEMPKIVKDIWDVTEIEIISASDFKTLRKDATKSFIYLSPVYFEKDKTKTEYTYLFLSLGHKSGKTENMVDLCAIPLGTKQTDQSKYSYIFELCIKHMQYYVNYLDKNHPSSPKEVIKYHQNTELPLSEYEFLIIPEQVENSMRSTNAFKSHYAFPFKFSNREEITQAIRENKKKHLVLHLIKAGENQYCFKLIMDASNGKLIYFDYHKADSKTASVLLQKDLKTLTK